MTQAKIESKRVKISIDGCDDSTEFEMELTETEIAVVEKISMQSISTSTYGCMPIISFEVLQ